MSKRKLAWSVHVQVQNTYGQTKVYSKILFDDKETNTHYKIKISEAVYWELAAMFRTMYQFNIADSEAEAKRYVDLVMQALSNVTKNKHKLSVIATELIDINEAIKARDIQTN